MKKLDIKVQLLAHGDLGIIDKAISKCWDKTVPEEKKIERMLRVANKNKHSSVIEHVTYSFDLNISRACLIELTRHRIASISVKSTRYTLGELKSEKAFILNSSYDYERAGNFIVFTGDELVDIELIKALESLRLLVSTNKANDVVKYLLPECYRTSAVFTINARSLQNFLELRYSQAALPEIRKLAEQMYLVLPTEHRTLFREIMNKEIE